MTKHPKRQQQSSISEEEQKQEAERRAKFVHELMIEKAPATIVSLIGQKEYEQCAEDLYFFLQVNIPLDFRFVRCLHAFDDFIVKIILVSVISVFEAIGV
jgi:hypothetical protein